MSTQPLSPAPRFALLYLAGAGLLGGYLVVSGLIQRLTASYVDLGGLTPIAGWLAAAGLAALDVGWPMIVLGSTLLGSAFGVYIGRRWAWQMSLVASGLALVYVWPGTLIGVIGLTLLVSPTVRRYCVH